MLIAIKLNTGTVAFTIEVNKMPENVWRAIYRYHFQSIVPRPFIETTNKIEFSGTVTGGSEKAKIHFAQFIVLDVIAVPSISLLSAVV